MVYRSQDDDDVHIAAEIKKTRKELDQLISYMTNFDSALVYDYKSMSASEKNAHKKWVGLNDCRAPFFWAVGPANENRLFELEYFSSGNIRFTSCNHEQLAYQSTKLFK